MSEIDEVFEELKTFECEMFPEHWVRDCTGVFNPFYGKKHTEETKQLLSKKLKGNNLGNKHADAAGEKNPCFGKFGADHPAYGHKKSDEFKESMSKRMSGENNPMFNRPRELHHKTKFTLEELAEVKNKFLAGMTRKEIYNYYNGKYSLSTIKKVVR